MKRTQIERQFKSLLDDSCAKLHSWKNGKLSESELNAHFRKLFVDNRQINCHVLRELIHNRMQFTPDYSYIDLYLRKIVLQQDEDNRCALNAYLKRTNLIKQILIFLLTVSTVVFVCDIVFSIYSNFYLPVPFVIPVCAVFIVASILLRYYFKMQQQIIIEKYGCPLFTWCNIFHPNQVVEAFSRDEAINAFLIKYDNVSTLSVELCWQLPYIVYNNPVHKLIKMKLENPINLYDIK